jgi:hypothetical protein
MNKTTLVLFLEELRKPVPQKHVERATAKVLESLESGEPARLTAEFFPAARRPFVRWTAVAAGLVAMAFGGLLPLALFQAPDDSAVARTTTGKSYTSGEAIRALENTVHLFLVDGSQVEMSANAVLSIAQTDGNVRIFLSEGQMIVTAVEQRRGRLYVETKDLEISVIGTVFSVNAGPSGSRVSVVEGEVEVRLGEKTQTLLRGQQVSTGSAMEPASVKADIEWSSKAPELVALLQQTVPDAAAAPASEPGTVTGRVTHEGTGEGIPDVSVGICPDPEPPKMGPGNTVTFTVAAWLVAATCDDRAAVKTDESGRFVIRDVSPGRYVLRARKGGYLASLEKTIVEAPTTGIVLGRNLEKWTWEGGPPVVTEAVTVGVEPPAIEVGVSMVRGAKLSGKVRSADGRFVGYTPVQIGIPSRTGTQTSFKPLAGVNTNASGEYRFGLPPGEYLIYAGNLPQTPDIPVPGTGALWISVKEGEDVTASTITQAK